MFSRYYFQTDMLLLGVALRTTLIHTDSVDPSYQKEQRDGSIVAAINDELQRETYHQLY